MKTFLLIGAATVIFAAEAAPRESLLTGTWIADLSSQQGLPTDVYVVRDGTYTCQTCVPRREYRADGRLRAVAETSGVSEATEIINASTISTMIVQRDFTRTTTMRVAPGGQTATYVSIDWRRGIEAPLRTEYLARRIAPAPPGSHAVSGTWQGVRYVSVPLQLRTTVLRESGSRLSYRTGTGFSYTAEDGGPFVAISGPYDGSISVSVRKIDPYRLMETRRRGDQDVESRAYTVAPDGRSMEIATTNLVTKTTFRIKARRQGRRQP